MNESAHRPRRRFGQNFLHDRSVLYRLVAAIGPSPEDSILEIGPGRGALTEQLLRAGVTLTAVELDRDLAAVLRTNVDGERFTLIVGDALKTDLAEIAPAIRNWRVVGNLPYNISTPLLFHLLQFHERIIDMHFLLQREVVQRLSALPHTKAYGRLSVTTQYHYHVEPLFEVSPEAFRPVPKVVSQLVRLRPRERSIEDSTDTITLDLVLRTAFSQRRKTLRRALSDLFDASTLEDLQIDPGRRPDTLDVAEYIQMAQYLSAAES